MNIIHFMIIISGQIKVAIHFSLKRKVLHLLYVSEAGFYHGHVLDGQYLIQRLVQFICQEYIKLWQELLFNKTLCIKTNSNNKLNWKKITCNSSGSLSVLVFKNFSRTILITLFLSCSLNAKYLPVEFNSYKSFRRLNTKPKFSLNLFK